MPTKRIRDSSLLDAQVDLGTIPDIDSGQPNSDFGPSPQLDGGPRRTEMQEQ